MIFGYMTRKSIINRTWEDKRDAWMLRRKGDCKEVLFWENWNKIRGADVKEDICKGWESPEVVSLELFFVLKKVTF